MTDEQVKLDKVTAPMRAAVPTYVEIVRQCAGGADVSLVLYGKVLTSEFDPRVDTAASVLVLPAMDVEALRRLAARGPQLGKLGFAAPVVMTPEFIRASLDTFALELIEIEQNRLVLLGPDVWADLKFEAAHVRMQCERELKTASLGMRRGLLTAAGQERMLDPLVAEVAAGLERVLRGMLWLKDHRAYTPAPAMLAEIETLIGRKLDGVGTAWQEPRPHGFAAWQVLHEDVVSLGKIVDAW